MERTFKTFAEAKAFADKNDIQTIKEKFYKRGCVSWSRFTVRKS